MTALDDVLVWIAIQERCNANQTKMLMGRKECLLKITDNAFTMMEFQDESTNSHCVMFLNHSNEQEKCQSDTPEGGRHAEAVRKSVLGHNLVHHRVRSITSMTALHEDFHLVHEILPLVVPAQTRVHICGNVPQVRQVVEFNSIVK